MKHTEETKLKLSEMRRGINNPFYGKHHTPETKARLRNISRLYQNNRQYKINPPTIKVPEYLIASYMAGLIDGEGSIGYKKNMPYIAIYNTSKILMDWLIENIGGSVGGYDKRGRLISYTWSVQSVMNVFMLLKAVIPYLIIKKAAAQSIINYLSCKYPQAKGD